MHRGALSRLSTQATAFSPAPPRPPPPTGLCRAQPPACPLSPTGCRDPAGLGLRPSLSPSPHGWGSEASATSLPCAARPCPALHTSLLSLISLQRVSEEFSAWEEAAVYKERGRFRGSGSCAWLMFCHVLGGVRLVGWASVLCGGGWVSGPHVFPAKEREARSLTEQLAPGGTL